MAVQLSFDLPERIAMGADDFYVSSANDVPYRAITGSPNWPDGKLALIGPKSSGKSHLARMFAHDTGALILAARDLEAATNLPDAAHIAIEDVEHLGNPAAQEYLFHLHNHLKNTGGRLLLTSDRRAQDWPITLPDLASRMQATTSVYIEDPDDALLFAVISKLFADRQLSPAPTVTAYLAARIDRSYNAAQQIVAAMDEAALAQARELNRGLAGDVLAQMDAAQ